MTADRALGLNVLGIEIDDAACTTRAAAGLLTLQADVATLDPTGYPCEGLIGSPPCPTFSSAGNGAGLLLVALLAEALVDTAAGRDTRAVRRDEAYELLRAQAWRSDNSKASARAESDAALSLLIIEPLRWALLLEPEWIALS